VRWIAAISPRSVLDPAVGPGIFPRLLRRECPRAAVTAIDVDPVALGAARLALGAGADLRLVEADFLTWEGAATFDAAVANPPYLRHHDMAYGFDIHAAVGRRNGITLSRLTNLYVLFVLEICRRLHEGGRAAIVVPAEWMNANFGEPLKQWLLARGWLHTIVYWSHATLSFEDALTTASVLLIERDSRNTGRPVRAIYVGGDAAPATLERALREGAARPQSSDDASDAGIAVRTFDGATLLALRKWNDLFGHGIRAALPGFVRLGELATTRRGIATGANRFFHLRASEAARIGVREASLRACVGRAADGEDHAALAAADARTVLLDIGDEPSRDERAYLACGERDGIAARYLCAARAPHWYRMERRPAAPVWAGVFARSRLRFVWNVAGVANLTAFHCIYPLDGDPDHAAALTACLNSDVVQAQARQHLRVYGAGLSKVEPRDLLEIPVPDLRKAAPATLRSLRAALGALDEGLRARAAAHARAELDAVVRDAAAEAEARRQTATPGVAVSRVLFDAPPR
jgi:adenine-specific DNA-methyltransferase